MSFRCWICNKCQKTLCDECGRVVNGKHLEIQNLDIVEDSLWNYCENMMK